MKKIILAILLTLSSISYAHQIESIRDVPWTYKGIAGDLLKEYQVNLQISDLLSSSTEESTLGPILKNKVNGILKIGSNETIQVTDFDIHFSDGKKITNVYLGLENKFEKILVMSLRYDLVKNEFSLKEVPFQVQKSRFKLSGKLD